MTTEAKPLQPGEPCPACGGDLKPAPVPTAAQRHAAADHENPVPLPAHFDTATEEFRAEHGALSRCVGCGYASRFPLDQADGAADAADGEGDGTTKARKRKS